MVLLFYISIEANYFYNYWVLATFLILIGLFVYFNKQPWSRENYETQIFVRMFTASEKLELCTGEDISSKLCVKQASKQLENALLSFSQFVKELQKINSSLVESRFSKPLETMQINISERILPRLKNPKEIQDIVPVLKGLAKMFGEAERSLEVEDIISKNKDLERFDKIEVKEGPSKLNIFVRRKPVQFLLANVLSFMLVFAVVLVQSYFSRTAVFDSFVNTTNFLAFLGIVIALGYGIYEVTKRV
jgi:hypothetical protein